MAAITAFPEMILPEKFGNYAVDKTYTAGADIMSGQAVMLNIDGNVIPATAGGAAIGVSLYGVASGGLTDVRVQGVVQVANSDDTTAIAGGVAVAIGPLGGFAEAGEGADIIGRAIEAIPGNGFGFVKIY